MKIAFLGLGRMGRPMARRLLDAGHDVRVWNRTPAKAAGFDDVAETPAACVLGAELVVTMLADPAAVRDVVFGSAAHRSMRPDALLVDMSTIGVEAATRLHESVGRAVLDAPVGGGVAQAETGQLTVLAGGRSADLDRVRGVLAAFGDVLHCGGPGTGQATKLAFNAVLAVTMSVLGEAVGLGERLGVDTTVLLEALERGGAGPMVAKKGERMRDRDYPPSFALALMVKDVELALDAARTAGTSMAFTDLARAALRRAADAGRNEDDYSAVVEMFRPPS